MFAPLRITDNIIKLIYNKGNNNNNNNNNNNKVSWWKG